MLQPERLLAISLVLFSIFLFSWFIYNNRKDTILFDVDSTTAENELLPQKLRRPVIMNDCKWPTVEPIEKDIIPFVTFPRSIKCNTDQPQLASLVDGSLLISPEAEMWKRKQLPDFQCVYRVLSGGLAPNTSLYTLSDPLPAPHLTPIRVKGDQIVVRCRNATVKALVNGVPLKNGTLVYEKTFVNFDNKFTDKDIEEKFAKADPLRPSMIILVLDSTSLNQFRRHMPQSAAFMRQHGFDTFEMYNKVGDNSAVNLLPILAGRPINEEVSSGDAEGSYVDVDSVRMLWDDMKARGCVTMIHDDIMNPDRGLFHYPNGTFDGFHSSPADFYLRPYHLYNYRHLVTPVRGGQCMVNGDVNVEEYLDIWTRFSLKFKDRCHFSFTFLTAISHDDPSVLGAADITLRQSLDRLLASGALSTSSLVVMGDHGNRIHQIQTTFTGRVEERAPLFSIRLPDAWKKANRELISRIRYNTQRLTTNYDMHLLLRSLATGERAHPPSRYAGKHLNPMFELIHHSRNCSEAGIPLNFCLCMESSELRAEMITTSDQRLFSSAFSLVKAAIREQAPCFDGDITLLSTAPEVYTLNQMVLHGLRNEKEWDDVKNTIAATDTEYLEIVVHAESIKTRPAQPEMKHPFMANFRARLKHNKKTGRLTVMKDIAVESMNVYCFTNTAASVCNNCYYDNVV